MLHSPAGDAQGRTSWAFCGPPATAATETRLPSLRRVPPLAMLGLLALWLLWPDLLTRWMFLPLLLSIAVLGIPHGALDLLVPGRLGRRWGRRPGPVLLYGLGYAGLVGVTLWLWTAAPVLTFWGFLLLTLLHWGQGDLHFLEAATGRRRPSRLSAPLALLARGSLSVAVPLLAFPEWFGRLLTGTAQVFGVPVPAGPLLPEPWPWVWGGVLAALLVAYALDTLRASPRPGRELGEAALLLAVFALVPAPLSLGVYFAGWHAWRHLGRLRTLPHGPAAPLPLRRLALDLLPVTLLALALLGGLALWAAPRLDSVETFAALYLALIAALTVPHALLVAWMDLPARDLALRRS